MTGEPTGRILMATSLIYDERRRYRDQIMSMVAGATPVQRVQCVLTTPELLTYYDRAHDDQDTLRSALADGARGFLLGHGGSLFGQLTQTHRRARDEGCNATCDANC